MTNARSLVVATMLLCGLSSVVWSQIHRGPYGGVRRAYPYGGWWGGINYSGNIGVTPAESQARGYAEAVRAQGQAYENVARGMVDYEKARSAYIENQKQWQITAQERQDMGMAQREKYYASERAKRDRRNAMNSVVEPPTLPASQYDRATGHVEWPELLSAVDYADDRKAMEELLSVRAQTGGTTIINDRIYEAAKAMQTKLKAQIHDVTPQQYLESKKFLELLASEARRGHA